MNSLSKDGIVDYPEIRVSFIDGGWVGDARVGGRWKYVEASFVKDEVEARKVYGEMFRDWWKGRGYDEGENVERLAALKANSMRRGEDKTIEELKVEYKIPWHEYSK